MTSFTLHHTALGAAQVACGKSPERLPFTGKACNYRTMSKVQKKSVLPHYRAPVPSPDVPSIPVPENSTVHKDVKYITCRQLEQDMSKIAYILDVQAKEKFVCTGHVPSPACKNIPVHEFMSLTVNRISNLLECKDKPVVVISNRGRTAASVAMLLTEALGFKDVCALKGGMQAWRDNKMLVELGTDCDIINAHCPWIDNGELLCSLQLNNHGASPARPGADLSTPVGLL